MQKCSRYFCPGSDTIFKEPASGGFLRSGVNPIPEHSEFPLSLVDSASEPRATQTDFMAKSICRFASVLRCQTGTA